MEETSMIRVLKIEPGRPPEEVKMANTLEALQEAVGGLIEVVTLDSDVCLICNDEGKLIGLPGNRRLRGDIIAGTFVIVGDDGEGGLCSLSDDAVRQYTEQFATPELFEPNEVQDSITFGFFPL